MHEFSRAPIYSLTDEELGIRMSIAEQATGESVRDSWVQHPPWCGFTRTGADCSCGQHVIVWYSTASKVCGVGGDFVAEVAPLH